MAALQLCERPIVLFDFDGTVADTGRAVMTSTRKTLAARGFSEAQMGDLMWRARTQWAYRALVSIRARRRRASTRRRVPMQWCTRWPSLLNFSLYKYLM